MRTGDRLTTVLAAMLAVATAQFTRAADPVPGVNQATHQIELGVGIGGAHFADYPGAARYRNLLLPVPYLTVRTPHLDANHEGLTGKSARIPGIIIRLGPRSAEPIRSNGP